MTALSINPYVGIGHALAVALGSAFLWKAVRWGIRVASIAIFVYGGTLVLIHGAPNYFLSGGVAAMCYSQATAAAVSRLTPVTLQIRWLGFALFCSLCGVGAFVEGGPVGMLGGVLGVCGAAFWWWLLVITRAEMHRN